MSGMAAWGHLSEILGRLGPCLTEFIDFQAPPKMKSTRICLPDIEAAGHGDITGELTRWGDLREACGCVVLLDGGRMLRDRAPDRVVNYYTALLAEENSKFTIEQSRQKNGWMLSRCGTYQTRDICMMSVRQ